MSLRKTLFVIGVVLVLLLPTGNLIRNKSPWTCFAFTLDEAFFGQAANNWLEGKGYRMYETKPFEPIITAGIPMAWGAAAIQSFTRSDLVYSGRIFVHGCIVALLLVIAIASYRRQKNWIGVPFGVGIFAFGLSKLPYGDYFAFGFLGEAPALLLGALAYLALDQKRYFSAGAFATLAFLMKPTFAFFPVAVGITVLVRSRKDAAITAGVMLAILFAAVYAILTARDESLAQYLDRFIEASNRIVRLHSGGAPGSPFTYYEGRENWPIALTTAMFLFGIPAFLRHRKLIGNAQITAFVFLVIAIGYYFVIRTSPVEKQWSAILALALIGFSVHWAGQISGFFAGWVPNETMRTIVASVILTFLFAVGQNAHHRFKHLPVSGCPVKEQAAVNDELRKLADSGDATSKSVGQIFRIDHGYFVYRLGWSPGLYSTWERARAAGSLWITGENSVLGVMPADCAHHWRGEFFSIAKCPTPQAPTGTKRRRF